MKRRVTISLLLSAFAAFADGPADTDLTLGEVELPVYVHPDGGSAGYTQPTVAYPISTVKATSAPTSRSTRTRSTGRRPPPRTPRPSPTGASSSTMARRTATSA